MSERMPVVLLSQALGASLLVSEERREKNEKDEKEDVFGMTIDAWKRIYRDLEHAPKAILVVSSQFQRRVPTVTACPSTKLLYDFAGPKEVFNLKWQRNAAPALSKRIIEILSSLNLESSSDTSRGLDHGAFIPLMVAFNDATVPVVEMSIISNLDTDEHLALGIALQELRDEGVLIIGSGNLTNPLGELGNANVDDEVQKWAKEFDTWMTQVLTEAVGVERNKMVSSWRKSCASADRCHPVGMENGLMPLMVCCGAAGTASAKKVHEAWTHGMFSLSAFVFQ